MMVDARVDDVQLFAYFIGKNAVLPGGCQCLILLEVPDYLSGQQSLSEYPRRHPGFSGHFPATCDFSAVYFKNSIEALLFDRVWHKREAIAKLYKTIYRISKNSDIRYKLKDLSACLN